MPVQRSPVEHFYSGTIEHFSTGTYTGIVPDQKRVQNPTMKLVFYLFQGVAEVSVNIKNHSLIEITHITDDLRTILDLLGEPYKNYYD